MKGKTTGNHVQQGSKVNPRAEKEEGMYVRLVDLANQGRLQELTPLLQGHPSLTRLFDLVLRAQPEWVRSPPTPDLANVYLKAGMNRHLLKQLVEELRGVTEKVKALDEKIGETRPVPTRAGASANMFFVILMKPDASTYHRFADWLRRYRGGTVETCHQVTAVPRGKIIAAAYEFGRANLIEVDEFHFLRVRPEAVHRIASIARGGRYKQAHWEEAVQEARRGQLSLSSLSGARPVRRLGEYNA